MRTCTCVGDHPQRRRIVLTGGPGAGKTAVLELVLHSFCSHVRVLPEAAGIIFGGGFPRGSRSVERMAAQRAIFHVQRELEAAAEATPAALVICDRGTVDGYAYWPGGEDFWAAVGTTRDDELLRYDTVIHLRSPAAGNGYNHDNPLRIETASEAAAIDERIVQAWNGHPRRVIIDSTPDFLAKARRAIGLLWEEMPECCRPLGTPWDHAARPASGITRNRPGA
jgi:predicted ATPase